MEVERRRIWPWVGLLLLAAVTGVVVEYVLRAPNRDSASKLVATFLSVATTDTLVARWLWKARRPAQASFSLLERAADQLAEQVRQQWEQAARERGLISPEPIPVWWQWSHRRVTGPVEAAVGGARFAPLPGMVAITAKKLRFGTIKDLLGLYGGLGSGRLVILGGPGAGKSGAAILLLIDVLAHRAKFKTTEERARVPVPVLFTAQGWDPNSEPLVGWLAGRLTEDYKLLRAREYGRDAAARLIGGGYIGVILDGLDEMAEALRPVALRALDEQATFRLVVLTRSQEMVTAVSGGHLRGAAALELRSVQAKQATEYLASTQTDPAPPSWQCLVKHLRDHPAGALAQALETPLMVSLVRDTYHPGDPVDELTKGKLFASREAIEDHLLDRVLPAAYTRRPGRSAPAYTLDQARRWLGYLARRMNAEGTRDLAWWQIPHWVPAWPRAFATVLACELVVGFVIVSGIGSARALVSKLGLAVSIELVRGFAGTLVSKLGFALTIGLVIGFMGAFGDRPPRYLSRLRRSKAGDKTEVGTNLMVGLVYGFIFGLVGGYVNGLANGLANGLVYGLVYGLMAGPVVGLVGSFGERSPHHLTRPRWSKTDIPINLAIGLMVGLVAGFMFGLAPRNGFGTGHGAGVVIGVVVWLVVAVALGLGQSSTKATTPIDPCSSWRRNRQFGLVVGLVVALTYGLRQSFAAGLAALIVSWGVCGLALGLAVGLVFPATWQVTLTSVQLWRRGEAPVRLLRFLEDARKRQVLRTVGQVYQFRHAQLQDRLAGVRADSAQARSLVPAQGPSD